METGNTVLNVRYLGFVSLPMRDGNAVGRRPFYCTFIVVSLPMRDGNRDISGHAGKHIPLLAYL